MQKCCACKKEKELIYFNKSKGRKNGFGNRCKACQSIYGKQWKLKNAKKLKKKWIKYYNENKEELLSKSKLYRHSKKGKETQNKYIIKSRIYRKERRLKKEYGMTLVDYNLLYLKQKKSCAICFNRLLDLKIDHDHETGKVRGLLYSSCNCAIGLMKDNTENLMSAIKYLNGHYERS